MPYRTTVLALALFAPVVHAAPAFQPTVNLQYDSVHLDDGASGDVDASAFRRARLGFRIKGTDWQFVGEHDLTDRTPADAYLELSPARGHTVRIGQFKQPFLLEDAISDKASPSLETSPLGSFAYGRRVGVAYGRSGPNGTIDVAAFGQRLDGQQDSRGVSARGTLLLHGRSDDVLHVGASLGTDEPLNHTASFSANAGTTLASRKAASTGTLTSVDRIDRAGIESVWIRGAGSVQAEVGRVMVHRSGSDMHGDARSVTATWSPSGDVRTYKRGVPGAASGTGHTVWELAARWSQVDLDDGAVRGGRARQYTLAAFCTPHPNMRIGTSLMRTTGSRLLSDPVLAMLRIQLTY